VGVAPIADVEIGSPVLVDRVALVVGLLVRRLGHAGRRVARQVGEGVAEGPRRPLLHVAVDVALLLLGSRVPGEERGQFTLLAGRKLDRGGVPAQLALGGLALVATQRRENASVPLAGLGHHGSLGVVPGGGSRLQARSRGEDGQAGRDGQDRGSHDQRAFAPDHGASMTGAALEGSRSVV
jgi:hypothetical protein